MAFVDQSVLNHPLLGPWIKQPGRKGRDRLVYPSVVHWYESHKFMPHRLDLRDAVIHSPTIREAKKLAKSKQEVWRSDWNLVRHKALIAGLAYLAIDSPELGLGSATHEYLTEQLSSLKFPERWLMQTIDKFLLWSQGPRIGVIGADRAPQDVVGKKLSNMVRPDPSWMLVSLANKQASWSVHDWALDLMVPIRYVGSAQTKPTSSLVEQYVQSCTRIVIFTERGSGYADSYIKAARALKVPINLEFFVPAMPLAGNF